MCQFIVWYSTPLSDPTLLKPVGWDDPLDLPLTPSFMYQSLFPTTNRQENLVTKEKSIWKIKPTLRTYTREITPLSQAETALNWQVENSLAKNAYF